MTIQENKDLIERYYAAFNKGGEVPFEDFFSTTFVDHNGYQNQAPGPAGVRKGYEEWSRAFPDCHAELADVIGEDDKVVVRTIATGTHLGEFRGIAPTRKKIRVEGVSIFRISDGKIQERWGLTEGGKLLETLRQE